MSESKTDLGAAQIPPLLRPVPFTLTPEEITRESRSALEAVIMELEAVRVAVLSGVDVLSAMDAAIVVGDFPTVEELRLSCLANERMMAGAMLAMQNVRGVLCGLLVFSAGFTNEHRRNQKGKTEPHKVD